MKYVWIYLVIGALVYGGWWFYRQSYMMPSPAPLLSVSPSPLVTAAPTATAETGVKVFNVSGANFRFDPKTITVKKGDKVRIVFKSLDMQHDWDITELGVDSPVTVAGETSEIEFTADKAGKFEYFCSVGNHRANGMVGTLIVE